MTERDGQIADLEQSRTDLHQQLSVLGSAHDKVVTWAKDLSQAVTERDGQIARLNQAVAERDDAIVKIWHSLKN